MPAIEFLDFKDLKLDLSNYRTVQQKTEAKALHAMISISPEKFWALTESLLQDGFHINENIVVLRSAAKDGDTVVREGNRRIAALKLLHGHLPRKGLTIPSHVEKLMDAVTAEWKKRTAKVPCAVYQAGEAGEVDKIVARTHGKAQDAGRDPWNAVARARHNRDENKVSEPSLDLLESYLKNGQNVTQYQKERWGGEYPLSILDEALKAIAKRIGKATSREVVDSYPKSATHRVPIEGVLHAIGSETLSFKNLRGTDDVLATYGFPAASTASGSNAGGGSSAGGGSGGSTGGAGGGSGASGAGGGVGATGGTAGHSAGGKGSGTKAVASYDPKAVARALRRFQPVGKDREKVVVLLNEIKKLKLVDHPHAFCFLLRSMFEISAKAYCKNQGKAAGLKTVDKNGVDRKLVEVLRDVAKHLEAADPAMKKTLHGAMAEVATPTGFLSVTSMNQLVHSPTFVISEHHIAMLFANVFPLLEAMNS